MGKLAVDVKVDGEADVDPWRPGLMQGTPSSVPVKEQLPDQSLHADPGVTGQVNGEADVGRLQPGLAQGTPSSVPVKEQLPDQAVHADLRATNQA